MHSPLPIATIIYSSFIYIYYIILIIECKQKLSLFTNFFQMAEMEVIVYVVSILLAIRSMASFWLLALMAIEASFPWDSYSMNQVMPSSSLFIALVNSRFCFHFFRSPTRTTILSA